MIILHWDKLKIHCLILHFWEKRFTNICLSKNFTKKKSFDDITLPILKISKSMPLFCIKNTVLTKITLEKLPKVITFIESLSKHILNIQSPFIKRKKILIGRIYQKIG